MGTCFQGGIFDTIADMEIQAFWNTYAGGMSPAELVWQFGRGDMEAGVRAYITKYPSFYGIMRRGSWRETFADTTQYTRQDVFSALTTYLELHRDEWEQEVRDREAAEAQARAEEKKRAEAEALAAAIARVEAESQVTAANGSEGTPDGASAAHETPHAAPTQHAETGLPEAALSQARCQADAEAIAAAMARVEAEARAKSDSGASSDEREHESTGDVNAQRTEEHDGHTPVSGPDVDTEQRS